MTCDGQGRPSGLNCDEESVVFVPPLFIETFRDITPTTLYHQQTNTNLTNVTK
jgi:hypothetical protein